MKIETIDFLCKNDKCLIRSRTHNMLYIDIGEELEEYCVALIPKREAH